MIRALAVALLIPLLLAGCSSSGGKAGDADELRIGLLAPLTGTPMRYTAHRAAQALVDRINAEGGLDVGGRKLPLRLFVEDTAGQTEHVMSATAKLIRQDRVQVILGPSFSREAIPAATAAEAAQVLMLTPTASNPLVTRGRRFVFRVCMLDSAQSRALAIHACQDLGMRRVAVLYDESDDYSRGMAERFEEAMRDQPGARALMLPYTRGVEDFSAALMRVGAFHAQALLLPNFIEDLPRQMAQARAAGFKGLFLGGDSWDSDRGVFGLPEAQGARFSVEFAEAAVAPEALAAARELVAKSGADLDKNTALTLDAMGLLFAAARKVGAVDSASLRSGLLAVRGFIGLTGPVSYETGGDPVRVMHIVEIGGGQLTPIKDITPDR
jgi:branched-chain amino acid transport system substrate-binding protein